MPDSLSIGWTLLFIAVVEGIVPNWAVAQADVSQYVNAGTAALSGNQLDTALKYDVAALQQCLKKDLHDPTAKMNAMSAILLADRLTLKYQIQKNWANCEYLNSFELQCQEKMYGKTSPQILPVLACLSDAYRQQKKYAMSEQVLNRMLAIVQSATPDQLKEQPLSITVRMLPMNFSGLYTDMGRAADAKNIKEKLAPIIQSKLGN